MSLIRRARSDGTHEWIVEVVIDEAYRPVWMELVGELDLLAPETVLRGIMEYGLTVVAREYGKKKRGVRNEVGNVHRAILNDRNLSLEQKKRLAERWS